MCVVVGIKMATVSSHSSLFHDGKMMKQINRFLSRLHAGICSGVKNIVGIVFYFGSLNL